MTEEKKQDGRKPFYKGPKTPKYSIASGHSHASLYEKKTEWIGEYVGREYGQEMRVLVLQQKETQFQVPTLKDNPTKQQELMWGKDYDMYLKKKDRYEENKAKVFAFILGQCDKDMKNKLQGDSRYSDVDEETDVVTLLSMIKEAVYDAHDKKSPTLQAVVAWKQLMKAYQYDNEPVLDYYKRFKSLVERVEVLHGEIQTVKIAEKDPNYKKSKSATIVKEKEKWTAIAFIEGAEKRFKPMLKDLEQNYSLGDDKYPETMEEALQVLSMYAQQHFPSKKKTNGEEEAPALTFLPTLQNSSIGEYHPVQRHTARD